MVTVSWSACVWLCAIVIALRLRSAGLYGSLHVSTWEFRLSLHYQCRRVFSDPFDCSRASEIHGYLHLTILCCGPTTRVGILNYLILLVCGDIHLNPGPICYPCGVCGKASGVLRRLSFVTVVIYGFIYDVFRFQTPIMLTIVLW